MKILTTLTRAFLHFTKHIGSVKTAEDLIQGRMTIAQFSVSTVLLSVALMPLQTLADHPFDIEGLDIGAPSIPGIVKIADPYGSVQELGAINGNSTKLGDIHSAPAPMLDFTNPNGQTDLRNIWLATGKDTLNDDIWLYFAWERDASSGSSVVAYEFQEAAAPIGCDYTGDIDLELPETPAESDLIANCNPWSGRTSGDFMIVWDFKGGATDIVLRNFDGIGFDTQQLNPEVFEAALNGDTSMGEGVINLSKTIFPSTVTECRNVGNVITGTITGNSDNADYKDTVLEDVSDKISISNCAEVTVKKVTVGEESGSNASFKFSSNLQLLPPSSSSFTLSDSSDQKFTNVKAPITGYWVQEDDPGQDFVLTDLTCTKNGNNFAAGQISLGSRRADFDLDRSDKVICTFTNSRKPQVKVLKALKPAGDTGTFDLSIGGTDHVTGGGNGADTGYQNQDIDSTPVIAEAAGDLDTDLSNYDTSISCDNNQSQASGTTLQLNKLSAGEKVKCTITNTRRPTLTIKKVCAPVLDSGLFNLNIANATTTKSESKSCGGTFGPVELDIGTYTVSETAGSGTDLANYERVISGDCTKNGSVTLAAGDTKTCTITNTRQPTLTVEKKCEPSNDSGSFSLQIDGTGIKTVACGGSTSATQVTIGEHTVSEAASGNTTNLGDYVTVIGNACDGDGKVTLAAGENKTCTITNKRKPRVKITKVLVPSGDSGTFNLSIGGTNHVTGGGNGADTGFQIQEIGATPVVGESAAGDTNLNDYVSSISCTGGQSAESSSLQLNALKAGDEITCTITNTRKPRLSVQKICIPSGDTGKFNLLVDGKGSSDSSCGETYGPIDVSIGSHTVSETQGTGTTLAHYDTLIGGDCPASGIISMSAGDVKTCTITNTVKAGAIQIEKTRKYASADSGDPNKQPHPGVQFQISGGSLTAPVTVTTDENGIACYDGSKDGVILEYSAKTSNYTVKEIVPVGYDPDNGAAVTPGKADGSVTYQKSVTIDQQGSCASGWESVSFSNTPLTDVKVTATAIDKGATHSNIECYRGSQDVSTGAITIGDAIASAGDDNFDDPETVELNNQLPQWPNEMIVCTIKIDP